MSNFRRIILSLEHEGGKGLLRKIRNRLTPHIYCVYGRELTEEDNVVADRHDIEIKAGDTTSLADWRERQTELPLTFYRNETDPGALFWWTFVEDDVAGIAWATQDKSLLRLSDDEVAVIDVYTVPTFRGRGIGTAMIRTVCSGARELGYRKAYATIEEINLPSRKAFEHAGFIQIGQFTDTWPIRRRPKPHWKNAHSAGSSS